MAREDETGKTVNELLERAWQILRKSDSVMLITLADEDIQVRPMSPRLSGEEHVIHFLTSNNSRKAQHIRTGSNRGIVFCRHGNGHASFTGTLALTEDRPKIRLLWSAFDKAWWDSPDDPLLCLVSFYPTSAELWDKPDTFTSVALLLAANMTGSKPRLGDHAYISTE